MFRIPQDEAGSLDFYEAYCTVETRFSQEGIVFYVYPRAHKILSMLEGL